MTKGMMVAVWGIMGGTPKPRGAWYRVGYLKWWAEAHLTGVVLVPTVLRGNASLRRSASQSWQVIEHLEI